MTSSTLEVARRYFAAGINLLPIRADGSKAPALKKWEHLQRRRNTPDEITKSFTSSVGLAAIGGAISGALEDFDFDDVDTFGLWKELIIEHLGQGFYDQLLIVRTPRPGFGVIVRCPSGVDKSQKLAWARNPEIGEEGEPEFICLIETKGEAGYFLLPGCPPPCHKSRRTYQIIQGDFEHIPELSAVQREVFLTCARSFNQKLRQEYIPEPSSRLRVDGGLLPGDDYKERGLEWREILEPHGYKLHSSRGETAERRCWCAAAARKG